MTDGNISMEEDTELRDLVVQTLENNGVLAKIRAELRASVFLALEEQESVMNPEPLLNKTVKQYLSNSEGKLLFSLVREFLEYFGLEYTISVYDPETYSGKEYNYVGRNKLCEELGITSTEPLLGEILKSSINKSALSSTQKDILSSNKHDESSETKIADTTYDLSIPKVIHDRSVLSSDNAGVRDDAESIRQYRSEITSAVGVLEDEKDDEMPCTERMALGPRVISLDSEPVMEARASSARPEKTGKDGSVVHDLSNANHLDSGALRKADETNKCDEPARSEVFSNRNELVSRQNNINNLESRIANNLQNKKQINHGNHCGKTIYFEDIIVDGRKESINAVRVNETYLKDVTDCLDKKISGSIFNDLPPLNGKRAIEKHDLKELMDIGLVTDDVDNYEEDFASSASVSTNERSPSKDVNEEVPASPQKGAADSQRNVRNDRDADASTGAEEADDTADETSCAEVIGTDKESPLTAGIAVKYAKCV